MKPAEAEVRKDAEGQNTGTVVGLHAAVGNKSQWTWNVILPTSHGKLTAFLTTKTVPLAFRPAPLAFWTTSVLTCGQV